MKTWIKRTLIGAASAAVLFGALGAYAARHHGGPWTAERVAEMKGRAVERVAKHLELDAAQKARLELLAQRLVEQREAMLAGDPHGTLRGLVAGPAFDRAGAEALLLGKTDALRAGAPGVIAAFGDFFDSLNPEQQQKLREFANRRHGGHGGHAGHGRQG
jgi:periplasmic protein CpxP/Spy